MSKKLKMRTWVKDDEILNGMKDIHNGMVCLSIDVWPHGMP